MFSGMMETLVGGVLAMSCFFWDVYYKVKRGHLSFMLFGELPIPEDPNAEQ